MLRKYVDCRNRRICRGRRRNFGSPGRNRTGARGSDYRGHFLQLLSNEDSQSQRPFPHPGRESSPPHEPVRYAMAMTPIGGNDENSGIMAGINITPFTDIFLVLLIIFMITSSAMVESGGKENFPKTVPTQSGAPRATLTLNSKHPIYVNQ